MPMVVMKEGVKESSLKRSRQHDLPTPESPISRSLICRIEGESQRGVAEAEQWWGWWGSMLEVGRRSDRGCKGPSGREGGGRGELYQKVVIARPGHGLSCDFGVGDEDLRGGKVCGKQSAFFGELIE